MSEQSLPASTSASADDDVIGYAMVLIRERWFYQGYFIRSGYEETAEELLRTVRTLANERLTPPSVVIQGLGLSPDDDAVIGSLSAAVVEGVVTSKPHVIAGAALALSRVWGHTYWWLDAAMPGQGGTHTKLHLFPPVPHAESGMLLPVTTPTLARLAISALPQVQAIQAFNQRPLASRRLRPPRRR